MNYEELEVVKKQFQKINKKGYILDIKNNKAGPTKTLTSALNIKTPEFKNIEIRIKDFNLNKHILLFKSTPIGKEPNQIKRIRNKYGYPESDENRQKIFKASVQASASTFVNGKLFRLKVDYAQEKVFLLILEKNFMLIDDKAYWTFKDLASKYNRHKPYLFLVKTWNKLENNQKSYKYYDYEIYKLKDFQDFLKLLEQGLIRVTFNISIYKKGPKQGEICDTGTTFEIEELDFPKLYEKI